MTFDLTEVCEKAKKINYNSPNGVSSFFIKLNDKWGLKTFRNKDDRDSAYYLQQECLAIGLAPEVGQKVDFQGDAAIPNQKIQYGYITEAVETIDTSPYIGRGRHCSAWNWYYSNQDEVDPIIKKLKTELNITFSDHHGDNWGRKDGKLIPIDFGAEGMYQK